MKKNWTKVLVVLLTLAMVLSMAACGGKKGDETTKAPEATKTPTPAATTAAPTPAATTAEATPEATTEAPATPDPSENAGENA